MNSNPPPCDQSGLQVVSGLASGMVVSGEQDVFAGGLTTATSVGNGGIARRQRYPARRTAPRPGHRG